MLNWAGRIFHKIANWNGNPSNASIVVSSSRLRPRLVYCVLKLCRPLQDSTVISGITELPVSSHEARKVIVSKDLSGRV